MNPRVGRRPVGSGGDAVAAVACAVPVLPVRNPAAAATAPEASTERRLNRAAATSWKGRLAEGLELTSSGSDAGKTGRRWTDIR